MCNVRDDKRCEKRFIQIVVIIIITINIVNNIIIVVIGTTNRYFLIFIYPSAKIGDAIIKLYFYNAVAYTDHIHDNNNVFMTFRSSYVQTCVLTPFTTEMPH